MKIVLDAVFCEEMCPNHAIEVMAIPEDIRNVWSFNDLSGNKPKIIRRNLRRVRGAAVQPAPYLPLMIWL